jgi:hypothetical protein
MAGERQQIMDSMNEERITREERAERRIKDTITSPNMGNKAVAEASLAWLINKGEVGGSGQWEIWECTQSDDSSPPQYDVPAFSQWS